MRYLLSNLPLNLGEEALDLAKPLAHALGGKPADYSAVTLERRSLDARHKGAIRFLTALSFETDRTLTPPSAPCACWTTASSPSCWSAAPPWASG